MSIASGVVSILDWLKDKLPIPNRLEAIKNEIAKLEQEKKGLLNGKASFKASKRLAWVNDRIKLLNVRMQNAAGNS